MKKAFTLAEALIALAIIGVVVTMLLRTLNRVTPDKEKVMYVKAYHTLEQVVADTINDPNKYDQEFDAIGNANLSQDPLSPDGATAPSNAICASITKSNALCCYAADKLNLIGGASCEGTGSKESPNFTSSNGIKWWGLGGGNVYPKTVEVDVNGKEDDGDFKMTVSADGKVAPLGDKETEYLTNQTKIR